MSESDSIRIRSGGALSMALLGATFLVHLALPLLGSDALQILGLLLLLAPCAILAYQAPLLTVVLFVALGQGLGEFRGLFPVALRPPALGPINLRYSDPLLLGIVGATGIALFRGDRRLLVWARDSRLALALLAWLAIQVALSIGTWGINTLGEFRTYYEVLFFVPYAVVFFPTEEKAWRLFKALVGMALLAIPLGVFMGGVRWGFEVGPYLKWMSGSTSLALVYGTLAFYLCWRSELIRSNRSVVVVLIGVAVALTLVNSVRSVWLAGLGAVVALALLRQHRGAPIALLAAIVAGALAVSIPLLYRSGLGPLDFLSTRLAAFTAPGADPTAVWRYGLWTNALDRIAESPVLGQGLGMHFQLELGAGELVLTSPHNAYITIASQIGLPGLLLFLLLYGTTVARLALSLRASASPRARAMLAAALIAVGSSSLYYVAYGFDHYTWLLGALGVSLVTGDRASRAPPGRSPG